MIDLDRWQEILYTLGKHKLRTALTAFGVFWGIFMLVVLLGAADSLRAGAIQRFDGRANSVDLWTAGRTQLPYQGFSVGRAITLRDKDRNAVLKLPNLELFSAVNNLGGWRVNQYVVRNDKSGSFNTRGVEPDQMLLGGYEIQQGRVINTLDFSEFRKVAFIGSGVRDILFDPNENPIGESLNIGGIYFKVIGVYGARDGGDNDQENSVILPNSTLRRTFNHTWYGHFEFTPVAGVSAIDFEKTVLAAIKEANHVHPDDNGAFGSFNMEREYQKVVGLFHGMKVFSWVVAIGTIFAGVMGVGNIMLIVVKERTREIGLQKALGATPGHIVATILQETLVLTFIAGYLGLAAGVFSLEGITALLARGDAGGMFAKSTFDFATALTALGVLILAGCLAAIMPASKAAMVNPIVALQDE